MIRFELPSLGADMDEGTLLEWRVSPGERVARGQVVDAWIASAGMSFAAYRFTY